MVQELYAQHHSAEFYNRALSNRYSNWQRLRDPSIWRQRDDEILEKMLRDYDIATAVNYRKHMIAGSGWNLTPRIERSDTAALAVQVGTELVGGIRKFTESLQNLAMAFLPGATYAIIHGGPRKLKIGDGRERTWWVPYRLEDVDKRNYAVRPVKDAEGNLSGYWEKWNVGKAVWEPQSVEEAKQTIRHVYQENQSSLGYGRGLLEPLGWVWYAKTHVDQEAITAIERFAGGTLLAKVNSMLDAGTDKPNVTLIKEFVDQLEDIRARHVGVFSKEDEVQVLEPTGTGWQMITEFQDRMKAAVYSLIVGANLTISADSGGSYALAEIQENSTEALIQFDRKTLEETLTDDLMEYIWYWNAPNLAELGILEEKPRFTIVQDKRQDPEQRVRVAQGLSQMGVDLPLQDVLDQAGFKRPDPEEPVIVGMGAGAMAPSLGGFGGLSQPEVTPETKETVTAEGAAEIHRDLQETALNGAQVTAAADLIEKVARNELPPGVVEKMLVSMFNLDPAVAKSMVDEARTFQPETLEPVVE